MTKQKNKTAERDNAFFFFSVALLIISFIFIVVFVKTKALNKESLSTSLVKQNDLIVETALIRQSSKDNASVITCNQESLNSCLTKINNINRDLVAPPAGAAENILVISAILMGLLGVIIFLGLKFRWYY